MNISHLTPRAKHQVSRRFPAGTTPSLRRIVSSVDLLAATLAIRVEFTYKQALTVLGYGTSQEMSAFGSLGEYPGRTGEKGKDLPRNAFARER